VTISPPSCLNGYILETWKRHMDRLTNSTTFERCPSRTISVPVLTLSTRPCHIIPFNTSTILSPQMISTYYLLPIHGNILSEPVFYNFSIARKSLNSALYHLMSITSENVNTVVFNEVLNKPLLGIHLKSSEFPNLGSYSIHKLITTGDTQLVDWFLNMSRMYS